MRKPFNRAIAGNQLGKTTGVRKAFDRQLFAENDARARAVVTKQLEAYGHFVVPNDNQYGIDLLVWETAGAWGEGLPPFLGVECEIKRVWTSDVLPWRTVQLPERKRKYLSPQYCTQFWILNAPCTHVIIIPGALLDDHKPVEVPNKYVARKEMFYQLPVSECQVLKLDTGV